MEGLDEFAFGGAAVTEAEGEVGDEGAGRGVGGGVEEAFFGGSGIFLSQI